jgi:hypothetical protein
MQNRFSTGAAVSASSLLFARRIAVANLHSGSGPELGEQQPFARARETLLIRRFGLTEAVAAIIASHAFETGRRP